MISTIIIIALAFMSLGMNLVKHGENKCDEKYNFFFIILSRGVI